MGCFDLRLSLAGLACFALACKSPPDVPAEPGAPAVSPSHHGSDPVRLIDAPPVGDVETAVVGALQRAAMDHRRLVVYVGATWCDPCQRFHDAAARGQIDAALADVDLLVFDLDRDVERLASAGYVSKLIPLFAVPRPDGRASGRQIEGGVTGEGAVASILPRLQELLRRP